jgi:phosphoribosylglycinamide formyltransferase 1
MRIAVFVSGSGTNLKALIDAQAAGRLGSGEITLVVSDKEEAFALKRAREAGIDTFVFTPGQGTTREEYDSRLAEKIDSDKIDLVVLAGFMRVLSASFVSRYSGRILNIHPALLPAFKGTRGIKDAYEYGVKVTGVTVHFVTEELDAGPVILQESIRVEEQDSLEELEEKIHDLEHRLYPEAVRLFADGKLDLDGRRVRIEND